MAKKFNIGIMLFLIVLTSSIYVMMPDNVKINFEKTNTKFYVWEDEQWTLGATEYLYLFDGAAKMRAKSRSVEYFREDNMTEVVRTANYKDNITTVQHYLFDGTVTDIELIPIKEWSECYNCAGKIVHYEFRDIGYYEPTRKAVSPESFDHRMKIEWQDGYYYAKVTNNKVASDKLVIRYKPVDDVETYDVRMFDPIISQQWNITSGASTSLLYTIEINLNDTIWENRTNTNGSSIWCYDAGVPVEQELISAGDGNYYMRLVDADIGEDEVYCIDNGTTRTTWNDSGIVMAAPLNEGSGSVAYDYVRNGDSYGDGTITGVAWDTGDLHCNAVNVDMDSTDTIVMPGPDWTPTEYSVSFWLKADNEIDYNQRFGATGGNDGWLETGNGGWAFHTAADGTVYTGTSVTSRLSGNVMSTGVWQNWIYTHNAGADVLYRNDASVLSGNLDNPGDWGGFTIGYGATESGVDGNVEDVRVFDHVLSAAERDAIYNSGSCVTWTVTLDVESTPDISVENLTITPDPAYTDDVIVCDYDYVGGGSDASYMSFYVNDVFQRNGSLSNYTCYQQQANESFAGDGSCSLAYTGSYAIGASGNFIWADANLTSVGYANDYYTNYTEPDDDVLAATFKLYDATGNTSVALPANCYNESTVQLFGDYISFDVEVDWKCWNGSAWEEFLSDAYFELYEEAIEWTVGNNSLGSTYFNKTDVVNCTVIPSNGTENGTAVTDTITISNTPPVISNVDETPDPAYINDTLNCTGTYSDIDGDAESGSSWKWFLDGTVVAGEVLQTLGSGNFSGGNTMICEYTPSDGTEDGTAVNSSGLLISNSAPIAENVSIVAYDISDASCTFDFYDADGHTESGSTYKWFLNGTVIAGEVTSTLGYGNYSAGDILICEVTPSDGVDTGSAVNSSNTTVISANIFLNGVGQNRTYEYGSRVNVTINANDSLTTCADVYVLGYGLNYSCENSATNFSFLVNLTNYTAIEVFTTGINSMIHKFRVKNWSDWTVTLPNYMDLITGTFDLTGAVDNRSISRFDDWANETQTEATYEVTADTWYVFNITFRNVYNVSLAEFSVYSPTAANLYVDVCNNNHSDPDTEQTSSFLTATKVSLSAEDVNNCTNSTDEFFTMPIAMNFTTGGNVTFSSLNFRTIDSAYPANMYLDVGNDSWYDYVLLGELQGQTGEVDVFNGSLDTLDFEASDSGSQSWTFYLTIPNWVDYTGLTMAIQAVSDDDAFVESFNSTTYINTSTTTADVQEFWGLVTQSTSGGLPTESWVYSKSVPTYKNVTNITSVVTDDSDDSDDANVNYWVSANGGANWTVMIEDGTTTVDVTGDDVMWKAQLTTDGTDYSYIYKLQLSGMGYAPEDLSLDVGNNGTDDWNVSTYDGSLTDISISGDVLDAAITSCTKATCDVTINFTWSGLGTLRLSSVEASYSTDDLNIPADVLNTYLTNQETSEGTVTEFNDSTTSKVFNNTVTAWVEIVDDVIVSSATCNIEGGYT